MRKQANNGHRFTMKLKGWSIAEGGMIGEFITGPRTFENLKNDHSGGISFDLYTDDEPVILHSRADVEKALAAPMKR